MRVKATSSYMATFTSKVFVPGPSGYDAAFLYRDANRASSRPPVEIQMSGSSVIYELDAPSVPSTTRVPPSLSDIYPGIRKDIQEGYLRYTFFRFRVPYVVAVQCSNGGSTARRISCDEADQVLGSFLATLNVVGGTPPLGVGKPTEVIDRPEKTSKVFTYYSPGNLMDNTAKHGGRADHTVYALLRFPLATAPDYANSQAFMNGGECLGDSQPRRLKANISYRCSVNRKPLHYFEGDKENFSYPWRNNFCEDREYYVGQCPGGSGHQGQDIRPSNCRVGRGSSCAPYQHNVVAAASGYLWRYRGQEALVLIVNEPNERLRLRYLHMAPDNMDRDGLISSATKYVHEGDVVGEVGKYMDGNPRGTTYHLHFDIQVPTKDGWVWVNPYMTLVAAYERLIHGRGTPFRDRRNVGSLGTEGGAVD
jgi:hypothetical protein